MFQFFRKLFEPIEQIDFRQLKASGATILDVRTRGEFDAGHIDGSINIPLDQLQNRLKQLGDKNRSIITCCASGVRSATATKVLRNNGFSSVFNGGGWSSLQLKLK
jgi:phage shock protein E